MPGGYRIRRTLAVLYSCLGFGPPIIRWALPAVAAIVNGSVTEGLAGKSGWIDHGPRFSRLLGVVSERWRLEAEDHKGYLRKYADLVFSG